MIHKALFFPQLRFTLWAAVGWFLQFHALAAVPVLDAPVPASGAPRVAPLIPVGKTVLLPLTASHPDGAALSFSVTSNNPSIHARIKTGNPVLRLSVNYPGDGTSAANAQPFSGDLVFQLFRDWTPLTADFIGGFAQAGFYNNLKFFRVVDDFVAQGGDPLNIGTGGPGMTPNAVTTLPDPTTAFKFDNEFAAPLIFSGRGQLAMANSGSDSTFKGSNGSQFFVTFGAPRSLDFKHTIFGQLLSGFDILDKIELIPTVANSSGEVSSPSVAMQIVSAKLEADNHDAVLVLSASGLVAAGASITVTVDDGAGGQDSKTFSVASAADTHNSKPFLAQPVYSTGPKDKIFLHPLAKAVDLEFDYNTLVSGLVANPIGVNTLSGDNSTHGQSQQRSTAVALLGDPGYDGPLNLAFGVTQYEMSYRGPIDGPARGFDDTLVTTIGVGDTRKAEPVAIEAVPNVALDNVVVARFTDSDPRGGQGAFNAKINWGDGSPISTALIERDPSRPLFAAALVRGSHTYALAGSYTVRVELIDAKSTLGAKGTRTIIESPAVVTAGNLRAFGVDLQLKARTVASRNLATFKDSSPAAPDQYLATVDWGDGRTTAGFVRAIAGGGFSVQAPAHLYADPESFSLCVRIHKLGSDPAADAYAWSSINLSGFTSPPHLPPFAQAHLIGQITPIPNLQQSSAGNTVYKDVRLNSGGKAFFSVRTLVLNSGNRTSSAGKLRFYLSKDRRLNLAAEGDNPADVALTIGTLAEFRIPPLAPQSAVRYVCDQIGSTDLRLRAPAGVSGNGMNLLAQFFYNDPVADHEEIERAAVNGPFEEFSVSPRALRTTEATGSAHTANFTVSMDSRPVAGKVAVFKVVSNKLSEGTVSPATLTFTHDNWNVPRPVTVTGVDDQIPDGDQTFKVTVSVDPDATTDPLFDQYAPVELALTNADDEPRLLVSTTPLRVTEAAGTSHTATFSVRLSQSPTVGNDVTVTLTNPKPLEAQLSATSLVFTAANGTNAQIVTVTAINDAENDGDVTFNIQATAASANSRFNGTVAPPVSVTTVDDDN